MSYDENRISDQIDWSIQEQCNIYSISESFSKTELKQHIAKLEYQLSEIKEHVWRITRDLKIFKADLHSR